MFVVEWFTSSFWNITSLHFCFKCWWIQFYLGSIEIQFYFGRQDYLSSKMGIPLKLYFWLDYLLHVYGSYDMPMVARHQLNFPRVSGSSHSSYIPHSPLLYTLITILQDSVIFNYKMIRCCKNPFYNRSFYYTVAMQYGQSLLSIIIRSIPN